MKLEDKKFSSVSQENPIAQCEKEIWELNKSETGKSRVPPSSYDVPNFIDMKKLTLNFAGFSP